MTIKHYLRFWLLPLLALGAAAHADEERPYSFGASETIEHETNVSRTSGSVGQPRDADWLSITEFTAALNENIGRQVLKASGEFDINKYKRLHGLDANGYGATGELDWSTVGDLSGVVGADSHRRQYFEGVDGDVLGSKGSGVRNLQTDNHLFANAQLGGVSRWTLFTGADANQRKYSDPNFAASEERQWSANAGTRYSTSPDLTFGLTANLTRGVYPNFTLDGEHDDFDQKSIDLTTHWQASGASLVDATIGYTRADYTAQSVSKFVNGSLNWTWTPPSHFTVTVALARNSSNAGMGGGLVTTNSLTGNSINNSANLNVSYELTAKTSLVASAQYVDRHYSNSVLPVIGDTDVGVAVNGSTRTGVYGVYAHFLPTRTTDVSCGVTHEVRTADAAIVLISPNYTNNTVLCTAAIKFD